MSTPDRERKYLETSSSLLARVRSRDPHAWSKLVSLYAPLIYAWCRHWGLERQAAEAVGQAVLIEVSQEFQQEHQTGSRKSFRNWLFELTRENFTSYSTNLPDFSAGKAIPQPSTCISATTLKYDQSKEREHLLAAALEIIQVEFTEQEWLAFTKVSLDNDNAANVAVELNCGLEIVYIAVAKVLFRLREDFAELIDFSEECPCDPCS